MQEFTRESGVVYSRRPHTRVSLKTQTALSGEPGETFELIVKGGTIDGTSFPGGTELGTSVVRAAVLLRGTIGDLNRSSFRALCGSVDYSVP